MRLAGRSGLQPDYAFLPLAIHDDYSSGKYHDDHPGSRYSEDEVKFELTAGGEIPIEWWFLVAGEFRLWNERRGEFGTVHTLDGSPLVQKAKADYLRLIGSAFDSIHDARAEAAKRGICAFPTDGEETGA